MATIDTRGRSWDGPIAKKCCNGICLTCVKCYASIIKRTISSLLYTNSPHYHAFCSHKQAQPRANDHWRVQLPASCGQHDDFTSTCQLQITGMTMQWQQQLVSWDNTLARQVLVSVDYKFTHTTHVYKLMWLIVYGVSVTYAMFWRCVRLMTCLYVVVIHFHQAGQLIIYRHCLHHRLARWDYQSSVVRGFNWC